MDVGSLIGFLVLYSEVGYFYLTLAMPELTEFSISVRTGMPHNDSLGVDHLLTNPYLEDDNDSSADISAVGFNVLIPAFQLALTISCA